jgi:TolB protein
MGRASPASARRTKHLPVICRAFGLLCMLGLALAGCGPGRAEPTPQPAILPLKPQPTHAPAALPPTVAALGLELPGRLLFASGGQIWLWQSESGHALPGSRAAYQPAWSPDGTRIAYIERTESSSDLLVMPSAGGQPDRLTSNGPDSELHSYERIYASIWAFYPAWSPDGAEIVFASQGGPPVGSPAAEYRLSLYHVPSAGGDRQQLYAADSGLSWAR